MTTQEVKKQFAQEAVSLAASLMDTALALDEFRAFYSANGFQSGGSDQITQEDIDAVTPHLSPALLASLDNALAAVSTALTTGHRNTLRKCRGGL